MKPSFSVIIPCYNEEKYLGKLLDNLISQSVRPHEVIVADCSSDDGTVEVANSYRGRLPIKIATTPIRSPGAARNAGARIATGDYLLFFDADCLPHGKRFIERLQTELVKRPRDFVTSMFTSDGWHPLPYLFFWQVNALLLTGAGFKGNVPLIGGMMCVRRSTFLAAGEFDEHKLLGEDTDYGKLLTVVGATSKTHPWLYVVHSNRRGRKEGHLAAIMHSMPNKGVFWGRLHQRRIKAGKDKKYGHF